MRLEQGLAKLPATVRYFSLGLVAAGVCLLAVTSWPMWGGFVLAQITSGQVLRDATTIVKQSGMQTRLVIEAESSGVLDSDAVGEVAMDRLYAVMLDGGKPPSPPLLATSATWRYRKQGVAFYAWGGADRGSPAPDDVLYLPLDGPLAERICHAINGLVAVGAPTELPSVDLVGGTRAPLLSERPTAQEGCMRATNHPQARVYYRLINLR